MNPAEVRPAQRRSTPEKKSALLHRDLAPRDAARWQDAAGAWQYLPSRSPLMMAVEQRALRVAPSAETVLILGETGVGKDLLALLVHHNSPRRERPFVHLNCASLSEGLLESELFGHMRGSYTGATENRPGQFEIASGGTLFLDEIAEIPPRLQAKLLHVIQERKMFRVGGRQVVDLDVRVIAATNRDLSRDIKAGTFRQDLYYRLGVVTLRVPPLRERKEDLATLARHFLQRYAALYNRPELVEPPAAFFASLGEGAWRGNVRELQNFIKRMILLGGPDEMEGGFLDPAGSATISEAVSAEPVEEIAAPRSLREVARQAVQQAESRAILQALERHAWNRRQAARELRMSYRSLLYKIKGYTLTRSPYSREEDAASKT